MIRYTHILLCPKTGREVSVKGHYYNSGVCEVCGHESIGTRCHAHRETGHWQYPADHKVWMFWVTPVWIPKDA